MGTRGQLRALIVGGGIGGLATAVALRRMNVDAQVFEAASSIEEVSAGLTLWPNAVKALRSLEVDSTLAAVSLPINMLQIRTWNGRTLSEQSTEEMERRFGAPALGVHRAALQATLLHKLGREWVQLGARLARFEQDGAGVTACFADGREERGDLLVGADGAHSVVRSQLLPGARPRYAGYTAWRGVATIADSLLPPGAGFEAWGRGRRFGALHIGLRRVYWFATSNTAAGCSDAPGGRKAELLEHFAGWHEPVPALVRETPDESILRNDVYDLEPLERWGEGRVALMGDAAHAMTPNLGQGAGLALEDAVVLALCVRDSRGEVSSGLQRYELLRAERARKTVEMARRLGKLGQSENLIVCGLRDSLARYVPTKLQLRQMEWLLAYEP